MKSVLGGLLIWDRHEQEAGKAILGGTDLKLVGVVVDDYPAERFSPPLPERARVACIDDRLLPDQGHNLIVEAERPRRPLPPGARQQVPSAIALSQEA